MKWVFVAFFLLVIIGRPLMRWLRRGAGAIGSPLLGGYDFYGLLRSGTPARGIVLKVGTQRSAQGTQSAGYYEIISVRLDVELDNQSPYEIDCQLQCPANLRRLVLPGATVELRVDPSSRTNIALYGPGVGLPTAG